jgi:hypothetical protein
MARYGSAGISPRVNTLARSDLFLTPCGGFLSRF